MPAPAERSSPTRLRSIHKKEEDARREEDGHELQPGKGGGVHPRSPRGDYTVISRKLGIGYGTVARIAALSGIRRPSGRRLVIDESVLGGKQAQKEQ